VTPSRGGGRSRGLSGAVSPMCPFSGGQIGEFVRATRRSPGTFVKGVDVFPEGRAGIAPVALTDSLESWCITMTQETLQVECPAAARLEVEWPPLDPHRGGGSPSDLAGAAREVGDQVVDVLGVSRG